MNSGAWKAPLKVLSVACRNSLRRPAPTTPEHAEPHKRGTENGESGWFRHSSHSGHGNIIEENPAVMPPDDLVKCQIRRRARRTEFHVKQRPVKVRRGGRDMRDDLI